MPASSRDSPVPPGPFPPGPFPPGPFPADIDWVPVPAPLLGRLLAEMDGQDELKVVLRILWHIHQKKGSPRPVRPSELCADRVVADALGVGGEALESAVSEALNAAAGRGILMGVKSPSGEDMFILNIRPEREALLNSARLAAFPAREYAEETWDSPAERPTIYAVYEQNIGTLTPIIGERLKEAAGQFSEDWIRDAIQIAVENNARNWKYVSAILERWQSEGRGNGEPGRDPEEARQAGYRRAYEKYVLGRHGERGRQRDRR